MLVAKEPNVPSSTTLPFVNVKTVPSAIHLLGAEFKCSLKKVSVSVTRESIENEKKNQQNRVESILILIVIRDMNGNNVYFLIFHRYSA